MALLGNPQDILTTPYGYSGQMSPETAIAEQALNRRRLLANLLVQQGLAQPQGRMVGRFYVAPNPMQGAANLASVAAGAFGNRMIDDKQKDVIQQDRQSVVDALKAWQDKQKQKQEVAQAPVGVSPQAAPQMEPAPPQQPYNGEVGATPMPDMGVQSAAPPIPATPPPVDAGMRQMQGLEMGASQPADMSQFAPQATDAQPSPQPAPAPTPQPQPRKTTMDDLADLLTHQHPQVRAYGQILAQQMQKEQEREANQAFMSEQRGLDRDVRREWIDAQSAMRAEMMRNTLSMKEMQLAQMERDSLRDAKSQEAANSLRAEIAKGNQDIQKMNAGMNRQQLNETIRHNKATEANALTKLSAKDETKLAEQEKSKKDVEGIIAVLRDSYNQLQTGGGVTDTSKGGLENMSAAASSSAVGQALGKTFGTQNQSHRNTIAQQRPILMGNISKALGMSAKQLDSNAELKLWLNAATDPTLDYQTNMRALDQLESMLGGSGQAQPGASAPAGSAIDALPQGAKQIGTSGGKPVFQTPDGRKFIGE